VTTPDPREDLAHYALRLAEAGMVAATDGNLSVRLPCGTVWTTPSGYHKGELSATMMVRADGRGAPEGLRPSSETPLHLAIYARRKDVNAVVHAHPPFATAFACTGRDLSSALLSEAVITLGEVPLVPFALPASEDLARTVAEALGENHACLLANHGAVTVGDDLRTAYFRMETLEQAARVQAVARLLGGGASPPRRGGRGTAEAGGRIRSPAASPGLPFLPGSPGGRRDPREPGTIGRMAGPLRRRGRPRIRVWHNRRRSDQPRGGGRRWPSTVKRWEWWKRGA